jgi:hypothetical protein
MPIRARIAIRCAPVPWSIDRGQPRTVVRNRRCTPLAPRRAGLAKATTMSRESGQVPRGYDLAENSKQLAVLFGTRTHSLLSVVAAARSRRLLADRTLPLGQRRLKWRRLGGLRFNRAKAPATCPTRQGEGPMTG